MNTKDEAIFWKKKEFISFLLSIFVFFIHSYFAQDYRSDSFISILNHKTSFFFSRSITQFAVPMFFMLSGITFFKEYDNKKYFRKIKSRIFTLVIPYLLWNTLWLIWEIFCSYSFVSMFSEGNDQFSLTLVNILKAIFFHKCYPPFWFVFDIIIFSFAAPLIFLLVRKKYIGIMCAACLSVISLEGIHLPIGLFYYPMSIVFYMIGAIVGYHYFDLISKKSSVPVRIASIILLSVYILAKNVVPRQLHITNYVIETVLYTLAAFALWNIVDIFIEKIKPRAIYQRSFAIYAMHLNVEIVIIKIFGVLFPQNEWLEIPKFIIMVPLTLLIINYSCAFIERFFPKIYALFMGNRVKRIK